MKTHKIVEIELTNYFWKNICMSRGICQLWKQRKRKVTKVNTTPSTEEITSSGTESILFQRHINPFMVDMNAWSNRILVSSRHECMLLKLSDYNSVQENKLATEWKGSCELVKFPFFFLSFLSHKLNRILLTWPHHGSQGWGKYSLNPKQHSERGLENLLFHRHVPNFIVGLRGS